MKSVMLIGVLVIATTQQDCPDRITRDMPLGTTVSRVYVRDLNSGRCVEVGTGKPGHVTVVSDEWCQGQQLTGEPAEGH